MRNREDLISGEKVQKEDLKIVGPEISKRLKSLRRKNNISQKLLSKKSKVSKEDISQIEQMKKMINVGQAKKIAKVLKVSPEYLIAG